MAILILILTFINIALIISIIRSLNAIHRTTRILGMYNLTIMQAEQLNLWKLRQDIYAWQKSLIAKEEYEAAQQTKAVLGNIEQLIKVYNQYLNTNYETDNKAN